MMKPKRWMILFFLSSLGMGGCSSSRTPVHEENHGMNIPLQQVQTRLDDSHHDLHCLQSEVEILEGRIKQLETSLNSYKNIAQQLASVESKQQELIKDVKQLSSHANATTTTFSQYKNRFSEMEKEISSHHQKLDEVRQLKGSLESVAQSIQQISSIENTYRVRAGDSLEKIAKKYKVGLEVLRKTNGLDNDRIIVGQELKIPHS